MADLEYFLRNPNMFKSTDSGSYFAFVPNTDDSQKGDPHRYQSLEYPAYNQFGYSANSFQQNANGLWNPQYSYNNYYNPYNNQQLGYNPNSFQQNGQGRYIQQYTNQFPYNNFNNLYDNPQFGFNTNNRPQTLNSNYLNDRFGRTNLYYDQFNQFNKFSRYPYNSYNSYNTNNPYLRPNAFQTNNNFYSSNDPYQTLIAVAAQKQQQQFQQLQEQMRG